MARQTACWMLALPLALVVTACGSPQAEQEAKSEATTLDQPGFEGRPATAAEAQSEAATLAGRLASGDLNSSEAAVALEDLDRLVNDNIVDFPESIRPGLTQDIQSAHTALESNDMEGLQEAAGSVRNRLSATASAPAAG